VARFPVTSSQVCGVCKDVADTNSIAMRKRYVVILAYVRQDGQRPRLGSTADGIYVMKIKDGRDGGTQERIGRHAVFSFTG